MTYEVKITAVKPAGVKWFDQEHQAVFEELKSWAKTLPGLIRVKKLIGQSSDDVSVKMYQFIDEAAYIDYTNSLLNNPLDAQRKAYNTANGIQVTHEVI